MAVLTVAMRDLRPNPRYVLPSRAASGNISTTIYTSAPRKPPKKITKIQNPLGRRRKKCTRAMIWAMKIPTDRKDS